MRLTERIWGLLTYSPNRTHRKWHPTLFPIDVAKLTKELNLAEEAKRLGEAQLPAADAQSLTSAEASVVQRVQKIRQDYVDCAALRLGILNADLARRNVTQTINRAMKADKAFESKASALLTAQGGTLKILGDAARNLRCELEVFQADNGLTNDARFPTPTSKFFRYALLLLMIVIEGVLNAGFFAQGVSTGLLGGFAYAGILAFLNVIVAFLFGNVLFRNCFHRSTIRRIVGVISLLIAIIIMITMGLGIAHVRDSLIAEVADPAKTALQTLQTSTFHLRDVFSWVLFFISTVFGVTAFFDGLYIDDLYPGYGSLSRMTKSAIDDYEDELNMLRHGLEKLKDEQVEALDKEIHESQAAVAVLESLIDQKKAVGGPWLSNALQDVDRSLEALLQTFRTENEFHRRPAPRPTYFDTMPKLPPLDLPDFDTTADETALAEQRQLVNMILAEVEGLRASIQEAFNQQFNKLNLLEHFPRKEIT